MSFDREGFSDLDPRGKVVALACSLERNQDYNRSISLVSLLLKNV